MQAESSHAVSLVELGVTLTTVAEAAPVQQAHGITTSHGVFAQAARDATVIQHHYHSQPVPKVDILLLLRLVRNLRQIQQDNFSKATPGTGVWFFKTPKFILWLDPNGNLKILWGTGIPGAGKTVLASIVINDLEARAASANGRICIAYIYFRYTDGADLTIRDVLEILVKQTIERHGDCASIAEQAYARHVGEGTRPTEAELLQLLSRFIEVKSMTFYILDALDEAPVRIQVDLVRRLASLNVRLFITSRPLKAVEARLPEAQGFTITAQEDDLDLHISQEIERSRDLQDLLERVEPFIKAEMISSIKNNCGGMFLHASLQLNELCDCASPHEAMEILKAFPPKIEDVYLRTWDRILKQRHATTARAVFLWVLYADRPMTIDEVERAVATCPTTYKFEAGRMMSRETLMTICCGLVTIEDDSRLVRLVHYTARDMLQKRLEESFARPHSLLAAICMAHLTQCGFQNTLIDTQDALAATLQGDPLLAYAFNAWAAHARNSLDDAESRHRTASFVASCKAFPSNLHSNGYRSFDTLHPLHILAHYCLPLDLIAHYGIGDPNIATKNETASPLMLASWIGNEKMVEDLLDLGDIKVNFSDEAVCSALLRAANNGHERAMNLMLAHLHVDVNLIFENGRSALMIAALRGHEGITQLFLARPEIQVNLVGNDGSSALMEAARGGQEGVVKLLLARPEIQVNLVDKYGSSALMEATRRGHESIVKLFLARLEVQIHSVDNEGWSALMYAAGTGRQSSAELLLACPKIDVNLTDNCGWTALMRAASSGHEGIVKLLLGRPETQINMVNHAGWPALMFAANQRRTDVLTLLLERPGIQINSIDKKGRSDLMHAASNGHEGAVKLLLARPEIKVNLVDNDGYSAFMYAVRNGCEGAVKLLLEHPGLQVDLTDNRGQSAFVKATQEGHTDIVSALLAYQGIQGNRESSPLGLDATLSQTNAVEHPTSILSPAEQGSVAVPLSTIPANRQSEDTWEVSASKRRKLDTVSEEN